MKINLFHRLSFFLLILFFSCYDNQNELKIAPVFSDHMVLQQQSDVAIWGSGSPGNDIKAICSWGEESKSIISEDGSWKFFIKTPKYGGPYDVKFISGEKEIIFEDVMIGEVWLTSGQSNMEWPMSAKILNQNYEINNANYPKIRMFSVPRNLNGKNIYNAKWEIANRENIEDFSAVGYFFAREIHEKLGVPVGILNSSWGGTPIEAWTSIQKLESIKGSSSEAKRIISEGGLDEIRLKEKKYNKLAREVNENYFSDKSYDIPESIEDWSKMDLDDFDFSTIDFDDSNWDTFDTKNSEKKIFTYENIFKDGSLAEEGVMWIRKEFNIDKPNKDYMFVVDGGIDDYDYTYINGTLIGKGFACCKSRSYKIPKNLLKKGKNILAIRVIDIVGEGAFRGPVYLKSENDSLNFDPGLWRFKHTAFYFDSSIQKHNLQIKKLLNQDSLLKANINKGISTQNPNTYSILYDKMIKPLIPYKIKGFLWYQGEENVTNYYDYKELLSGMIDDWRDKWEEKLPFYFVQIAPYGYSSNQLSQELREAQRKTLDVEKTGMAVTLDIGEKDDIHPANKQDVGLRLAKLALANDYSKFKVVASGPLYKSKNLYDSYIDLYFDYVGSGLISKGLLDGFEIAGSDSFYYPAKAKIVGDKVRVYSKKVKNPKTVRYGWQNYFDATLFNKEGLPASSFQTN
tara:strand:+ start:3590 stop:5641 length:2052 start_codon:yes stop_codon:yes gene_type:complete